MQVLNDDNNDTSTKRWHRFGLLDALEHGSHWANFHIPDAVRNGSPREQRSYCLWLTCVWRINTSLSLCKLLSPWDDDQSKEWVSYQFKLFRDTHLDMLSMMFKHKVYDDEAVATQHHILRDFYPLCNRVCCAEELPDFVGYATDNFKTGSNLKERSSLDDKIGHLYVNKTGPNICKIRNFYDIIIRYGEEDPVIYDILKNVIKCVLLGNLPHSRGNLNMMALIELNLFFYPDEADAVIPEEEFKELTKNKSMKRNRSKKKTKDEVVYVKTKFILWLLLCRHFVLYLLKEFLFYIAESSEWLNELLSEDYKFIRYREIVLIGNGQCRNKLSQQAKKKAPGSPFDWSEIEFEEKSTETYDTKSGEIKKFHAWSLTVARKVQKDDFMKILAKKMTNTEETLHIATPYKPFYYVRSKGELPSEGRMIALDELHEICEYMSKNRSRIIESRWFQVIGMSRKGLETLRLWLFRYDKYDIPDNSLKNLIREFYSNSPIDYMILKTVIKVIEYYKQDQVFHLPLSYAKKQIFALRNLLGIEDWEPTPALLGYAYQCPGCLKFANTVIEPVDHTHKQCPAGSSSCSGGGDPTTTTTTKKTTGKGAPKKNTQIKGEAKKKGVDGRKTKGKETQDKKKKKKKKKDKSTASANAANSPTSCFLNMAFYDMDTCSLHCSKYSSNYKHTLLGDDLENGNIIMKSRDGSIIIRSNKTILLKPDGSPVDITNTSTSASRTTTKKSQSSSQASKEREAQKFQWLLERRVFEFNDANDGDDPSNDNITCGLYAAPEPVLEDDGETISPTELFTPRLAPKTAAKKSTKKKIFLNDVNRAISDMGLTCNKELQKVDMIGIIKNNHVFCTEPNCGSMTLACNYNSTNHGITCGKHKSVYDSNYDAEPSLSNPDKRSEAAATKKRDIADGANAIIMMGDSSPHYENDQMIENNTTPPPTMLISNNNNSIQSSQSVLYRHHQTTVTNQTLKSNLHPLDIVEKGKLFSPQSGHIEGERCAYCNVGGSKYRVSAMGYHRKILKIGLCKPCYDLCSVVINKHDFLPLSDVYNHLKSKKPLSI